MRTRYRRWLRQEVRWGDMDALRHVNNAAYFTYMESARMALFEALGLERWSADGAHGPVLATASCSFEQQVRFPAALDVGLVVARIGGKSFTLDYGLFLADAAQRVATGSSVVVWADYAAGRGLLLPDGLRAALEPLREPQSA